MTELYDLTLIRYRYSPQDEWAYELCTEEDLESYQNTKDSYTMCADRGDGEYQKLNAGQLEIVRTFEKLNISDEIVKIFKIMLQVEPESYEEI